MERLDVGVLAPHTGMAAGPGSLTEVAVAAEQLGFGSLWVGDHIVLPAEQESAYPYGAEDADDGYEVPSDRPFLEATTCLAFLAAVTERIRLGISVAILPYRAPAVWAKTVGTLDVLAGGRIVLGAGVGWLAEEFDVLGADFASRGRRTDETLRFLRAAWAATGPVEFDGEFCRTDRMFVRPSRGPGASPPPVWVGGNGAPALRRTAELGDVWHPHVRGVPPDRITSGLTEIRSRAAAAGREDVAFGAAVHCPLVLADRVAGNPWELGRVEGPPAFLADTLARYRAAGLTHVVLTFGGSAARRIDVLERVAEVLEPEIARAGDAAVPAGRTSRRTAGVVEEGANGE